ncbi:zinc-ribbon domain-containing protein [Arthrobacter sp. zg-Y1143]|uniref:zinc-ribbon domain-containing protein n=1 Tax=Arthrobacter sp. zg-Y1143 TaxID=3049065 RepID=UPI0024C282F3|nr:zinc-ribbon domain-containing protein [Arthrobacter sp. zg-Y1143]MDK1327633.1 zinc-ribbon domain-containing protein [Arthrobacter sp. zg-Y1143]
MLFILGFKTVARALFSRPATCQYCGAYAPQQVEERANRLTLFFIPVLTTSRRYAFTCSNCGQSTGISRIQKIALQRG